MTTEQILQECKDEIIECIGGDKSIFYYPYPFESYVDELRILYAKKIAELFAEWIRTFEALQIEPANRQWYVESQITTSELYTEFLNQLNSTK